jgi:hypothetical protein
MPAGRLVEAFDEVLDLGIPKRLRRLVDVYHLGPLEVCHGAGYCVQTLERLTSRAVAQAQPHCRADGRSGARREVCDQEHRGAAALLPLDRYRIGGLTHGVRADWETTRYWLTDHWRGSPEGMQSRDDREEQGGHPSSSSSAFASLRSGVPKPSVNQP